MIIEDEELAVRKLTKLIQDVDSTLTVVGTTPSIRASVNWLADHAPGQPSAPDLIFMPIELADGQSFEIFDQITVMAVSSAFSPSLYTLHPAKNTGEPLVVSVEPKRAG